jgi:uncharacterized DUF497 family protein
VEVVGFDWDKANRTKCQQHGVPLADIESVFHGTLAVFPDPTHSHREERFIAIGQTAHRRHVFIAFTLRTYGTETYIRPISARYIHRKEVVHYEKEIAKTGD